MGSTQQNDGTIMVIGASGGLGTYLVDELVEKKHVVFATGMKNLRENYYTSRGVQCAVLDITRKEYFDRLPTHGVRAVILIAGIMPSAMFGYNAQQYIDVNITGTHNVLEYCRKVNVKKLIFTQSHSDVAGYWNTGKFIPSDCPRSIVYKGDHAVYIISKNAAVDLIEHYHQEYGLQTIVFRLPTIYYYHPNSKMYQNGKESIIAYRVLIKKAMAGEDLEIWGDPKRSKDIVYIKDFNQMCLKALASDKARGIYNIGSGVPTTLEEQIRGIAEVFCPKEKLSNIIYRPEKPSQNSYLYDIKKAVGELGYKPEYFYIQMLEDMKCEMAGHRFDHLIKTI